MKTHLLQREQIIARSKSETFDFFSDAFNLERITPAFLNFKILTPKPIEMKSGAIIEYKLGLYGFPFKWKTLIETWTPGEKFVDTQLKGPYELWRHTHEFEELGPERTLVRDRVEYRIPFGIFGAVAHALFVKSMLRSIFDYRARAIDRLLRAKENEEDLKERGYPGEGHLITAD